MANTGIPAIALACNDAACNFKPMRFKRRPVGDFDVHVEMKSTLSDVHVRIGGIPAADSMMSLPEDLAVADAPPDSQAPLARSHCRRPQGLTLLHQPLPPQYCGVCHSDLHFAQNDLGNAIYPMCPGHELAGVAISVGSKVTAFKVGDQ
ncbi:hypothetical protein T492DRAFT_885773 [Pavlovales sp. CCMP2436]|nr:hypothetical protein T492DRAFT_885773 [Pavlovales sp. CCMP2436]